jgi:predicted nucleic acid-binding protein
MIDTSMAHNALVDSDFLIALYSADDRNHTRALHILEDISQWEDLELSLSLFVYSETVTVLSQRVSQKTAHFFMNDLEKQGATIIDDVERIFTEAQDIFRTQRSKNVSFVDATNIAFMRSGRCDLLLSFDRDYRKNGIEPYAPGKKILPKL